MVEGRARRDFEAVADLAHRRRHPVPLGEGADELEDLALPDRQLAHVGLPWEATILNVC